MIEWIKEKEWETNIGVHKGTKRITKVCLRVCDECGKREEASYFTTKNNRRDRKSDKDYCYSCSQKLRQKPKGPAFAKWKHGLTYNGYVRISVDKKRILEHTHVMSQQLGRKLVEGETVHHIDMDKTNNVINNLYLFPNQKEHQKCHMTMERCGFSLFQKLIFFDWETKKYVLETKEPINREPVQIPAVKIFQMKSGQCLSKYWFYTHKTEDRVGSRAYHLLVAETFLGRHLYQNECVHHVNGNALDNDINNLCILAKKEHTKSHCSMQLCVAELYRRKIVGFSNGNYFLSS